MIEQNAKLSLDFDLSFCCLIFDLYIQLVTPTYRTRSANLLTSAE
jgi:hypothetical protein